MDQTEPQRHGDAFADPFREASARTLPATMNNFAVSFVDLGSTEHERRRLSCSHVGLPSHRSQGKDFYVLVG